MPLRTTNLVDLLQTSTLLVRLFGVALVPENLGTGSTSLPVVRPLPRY